MNRIFRKEIAAVDDSDGKGKDTRSGGSITGCCAGYCRVTNSFFLVQFTYSRCRGPAVKSACRDAVSS